MDISKESPPMLEDSSILLGSFYVVDSDLEDSTYRFRAAKKLTHIVLTYDATLKKKSDFDPLDVYDLLQKAPLPTALFFADILDVKCDEGFYTLISPRYGPSLYEVLEDNTFRGFSKSHCRKISFEILSAVQYLHDKGIIHTDLNSKCIRFRTDKLSLITDAHSTYFFVEDTRIVLCDLTKCRHDGIYMDKIQQDIYRAPEVIMGLKWNRVVDSWAVGCVLSEVFCGSPLFESQKRTPDWDLYQLTHIMTYCGIVPYSMTARANPKFNQFPKRSIFTNNKYCIGNPDFETESFNEMYRVIRGLMNYEPSIRMSCKAALTLPFYTNSITTVNGYTKHRKNLDDSETRAKFANKNAIWANCLPATTTQQPLFV